MRVTAAMETCSDPAPAGGSRSVGKEMERILASDVRRRELEIRVHFAKGLLSSTSGSIVVWSLERRDILMATPTRPKPAVQDPVKVDSKHYKAELENEKVRVLRAKYKSHEKSVMHGHPASVAVFLSDARFRFTFPDGKVEDFVARRKALTSPNQPLVRLPRITRLLRVQF